MNRPQLMPSEVPDGRGPGLAYRIEGELVPVLHLALDGGMAVYFEHHVVLWKQPQLDVVMHRMKGAFKRLIGGMPIFMTEARGQGEIAFSRDNVGHVFPLAIPHGGSVYVREHQFLAATGNLAYTFERVRGFGSMLFGQQGFFVDRFEATEGDAILWLHAHGNAFEVDLGPGESIDVEPGGWVYRDPSVQYAQQVFGLKTGLLGGGGNLVWNRFTGPGRVGLQSAYYAFENGPVTDGAASGGLRAGVGGAALGGILGGILGSGD